MMTGKDRSEGKQYRISVLLMLSLMLVAFAIPVNAELIFRMPFDSANQLVNNTIVDAVGGQYCNNAQPNSYTAGKLGQAMDFVKGGNNYVICEDLPNIDTAQKSNISALRNPTNQSHTISFWTNHDTKDSGIVFESGSGSGVTGMFWRHDAIRWNEDETGSGFMSLTSSISIGTWHHVVMTYDELNGNLTAYIDGVHTSSVFGSPISNSDAVTDFYFGAINSNPTSSTFHYDGQLDEWCYFNETLTEADVDTLYNSGNGENCTILQAEPPDITPPTTIITSPLNNTIVGHTVELDVTCADETSLLNASVEFKNSTQSFLTLTNTSGGLIKGLPDLTSFADGNIQMLVSCYDTALNSLDAYHDLTLDGTVPTIVFGVPNTFNTSILDTADSFYIQVLNTNLSTINLSVYNSSGSKVFNNISITSGAVFEQVDKLSVVFSGQPDAVYDVEVCALDIGNNYQCETHSMTLDNNPPIISGVSVPSTAVEGESINVQVNCSDTIALANLHIATNQSGSFVNVSSTAISSNPTTENILLTAVAGNVGVRAQCVDGAGLSDFATTSYLGTSLPVASSLNIILGILAAFLIVFIAASVFSGVINDFKVKK